jgi:hypothetical protein
MSTEIDLAHALVTAWFDRIDIWRENMERAGLFDDLDAACADPDQAHAMIIHLVAMLAFLVEFEALHDGEPCSDPAKHWAELVKCFNEGLSDD